MKKSPKSTLLFFSFMICIMIGGSIFTSCEKDEAISPDWTTSIVGNYDGTMQVDNYPTDPAEFTIKKISDKQIAFTIGNDDFILNIVDRKLFNNGYIYFFSFPYQTVAGYECWGTLDITAEDNKCDGYYYEFDKSFQLAYYVQKDGVKSRLLFTATKL